MVNICPLLIRASFIGRTYHDFQLKFVSPSTNCTTSPEENPLLIQFTRILNSTFNDTSYALYDPLGARDELPQLQVFNNDQVKLCIRSALDTEKSDQICHEFYMITMLSSVNRSIWPLLIIFGYVTIVFLAILFSLLVQIFSKFSQKTFFSGSITKKLVQKRDTQSLVPLSSRHVNNNRLIKLNEKKEIFKTIDFIANECHLNRNTFIIQRRNIPGHVNRTFF